MTKEQLSAQWLQQEKRSYQQAYGELDQPYDTSNVIDRVKPVGNLELPIAAHKEEIVASVDLNQLTIIVAETGAGKSTQVPQFLIEAGYTVVQTQPRRIAARKVAERIGQELMEAWPDAPRETSGYHTAEKNTCTDRTLSRNVTDGLLLAQEGGINGRQTDDKEVVVVDEAHEWGMNVEMELGFIYRQMIEHPERRFVIMSATINAEEIQEFYATALEGALAPIIRVEGRTFPVEKQEFSDETVVQRALVRAKEMNDLDLTQRSDDFNDEKMPTGFIVAAPGVTEIKDYIDEIRAGLPEEIAATATILPLHSKMSDGEQNMAMRTDYPGIKIIVATNVAKTSLTIPGIAGVIDSGYARHEDLDHGYRTKLTLHLTSYADRMQWAGRCGRIAPGWYDLACMNEDMPYISLDECEAYESPASQRINPIDYALSTANKGVDFSDWPLVHRVPKAVILHAQESLRMLGALDDDNNITAVGRRMNELPLDAVSARMMVEADQYSPQVRSYMAAIVSAQAAGGLPLFAHNNGRRWKDLVQDRDSDLIAQLDIFTAIQRKTQTEIKQYDLDVKNVERAQETFWRTIRRVDGSTDELLPPTQEECAQIKTCIYAGMTDGMYRFIGDGLYRGVGTRDQESRSLSTRSVVQGKHSLVAGIGRQIEKYTKRVCETKEILEGVTVVDDVRVLGDTALKQLEWRPTGHIEWHDGRPHQQVRQHLHGIDLGMIDSVPAEPSADVQKFLVDNALNNPGFEQKRLREIKAELERLNHLTAEQVPQLTQDELIGRLYEATPIDELDPRMTDVNLQMMNVQMVDYLSEQDRQRIIDNAPTNIETASGQLAVEYRGGRPLARKFDMKTVLGLTKEVALPDGRNVYFVHNRHEYTLQQLKTIAASA